MTMLAYWYLGVDPQMPANLLAGVSLAFTPSLYA